MYKQKTSSSEKKRLTRLPTHFLSGIERPLGIYIHWPYCRSKCPYCDFNSYRNEEIDIGRWEKAFKSAFSEVKQLLEMSTPVSVFFGGGTPSLMPLPLIAGILEQVARYRPLSEIEVTLEANPTSVEADSFRMLREIGVNRLSLGIQALEDKALHFLGREHSVVEALRAFETARKIFDRCSFDLIYARPGQSCQQWEQELSQALSLDLSHMSLYQLTIERNTPFYLQRRKGEFEMPDEEAGARLYELTQALTAENGLFSYEVSNYAVPGQECLHNLLYWQGYEYVGIGPGAHGRVFIQGKWYATRQHKAPSIWLEEFSNQAKGARRADGMDWENKNEPTRYQGIDKAERQEEMLMMGLRLAEGIDLTRIAEIAGDSTLSYQGVMEWIDGEKLRLLIEKNYLSLSGTRLKATPKGRLLLDAVLDYLLN